MKNDAKKALYESIMASVAKEVKKALNESYDDWDEDEDEYEQEEEFITYENVLDAMFDINPREIIESDGQIIEDIVLNNIMYPENGSRIALVAVDLAQEMIDDKLTYDELYARYADELETEI